MPTQTLGLEPQRVHRAKVIESQAITELLHVLDPEDSPLAQRGVCLKVEQT